MHTYTDNKDTDSLCIRDISYTTIQYRNSVENEYILTVSPNRTQRSRCNVHVGASHHN